MSLVEDDEKPGEHDLDLNPEKCKAAASDTRLHVVTIEILHAPGKIFFGRQLIFHRYSYCIHS
jgi:hypothetical protein